MKIRRLFLLFILITISALSCMKRPDVFDEGDGDPVNLDHLQESLLGGFGETDPAQIKQDEFTYGIETQRLADYPEKLSKQTGLSVYKITDSANTPTMNKRIITLVQQAIDYGSGNEGKASQVERNVIIDLPIPTPASETRIESLSRILNPLSILVDQGNWMLHGSLSRHLPNLQQERGIKAPLSSLADRSITISLENFYGLYMGCVKDDDWDVKCFNFVEVNSVGPPPDSVKNKANCGGIPNCQIRYRKIKFDLSFPDKDLNGENVRNKWQYQITLSPDVPYLSRILEVCRQGIIPIDPTLKIYARVCERTLDFEPGK